MVPVARQPTGLDIEIPNNNKKIGTGIQPKDRRPFSIVTSDVEQLTPSIKIHLLN